jgi:hypothetical protein
MLWFPLASAAHGQDAGGVYLHSAGLASQVDAMDAAAQASNTLKPYDDQLANLTDFARQEDLAVATLGAARRDGEVQGLLATPVAPGAIDGRAQALRNDACGRLKTLLQVDVCTDDARLQELADTSQRLSDSLVSVQAQTVLVSSDLHTFARRYPQAKTPNCVGVAAQEAAAPAGTGEATWLDTINTDCQTLSADNAEVKRWRDRIAPAKSDDPDTIAQAAAADATAAAKASGGGNLTALQAAIGKVQAAAKAGGDLGALADFETSITSALSNVDPVLQVAGLKAAQSDLAEATAAVSCAGASVCQAQLNGAITGKASAAVGMLHALAQMSDTVAGRSPAAHWLAAAQAIVAAHKADAQLQADADKANAAAAALRYRVRVQEASLLAATALLAEGQGVNASGVASCQPPSAFACALPFYVDSWNQGRVPAQILSWRAVQQFRALTVQRQRLVAQEQRSILLAATATLKAYGDGGVDPSAFAQLLGALGVIAIAAK